MKKGSSRKGEEFVVGVDEETGKVIPPCLRIHFLPKSIFILDRINIVD